MGLECQQQSVSSDQGRQPGIGGRDGRGHLPEFSYDCTKQRHYYDYITQQWPALENSVSVPTPEGRDSIHKREGSVIHWVDGMKADGSAVRVDCQTPGHATGAHVGQGDKQGRDNTLPGATDARQTKKKHHPSALPSYRR